MNKYLDEIAEIVEKAKTERDELIVQLKLGSMELREDVAEEWQKLDKFWNHAQKKRQDLEATVEENAQMLKNDVHQMFNDIKIGYEKLKRSISKS